MGYGRKFKQMRLCADFHAISIHLIWFLTTWVTVENSSKCVFVPISMLGRVEKWPESMLARETVHCVIQWIVIFEKTHFLSCRAKNKTRIKTRIKTVTKQRIFIDMKHLIALSVAWVTTKTLSFFICHRYKYALVSFERIKDSRKNNKITIRYVWWTRWQYVVNAYS